MVSKLISSLQETSQCVQVNVTISAAGWSHVQTEALDDLLSYVAIDSCTGLMSLSAITTVSIKLNYRYIFVFKLI